MKKQYNTHLWIAATLVAIFIAAYIVLDALNPVKSTNTGLGGLPNLGRAFILFPFIIAALISLLIAVFMFIYDACLRLEAPREKALWIVLLILCSVVAFPIYLIINGTRRLPEKAQKTESSPQDDCTDMFILAFLPQLLALVAVLCLTVDADFFAVYIALYRLWLLPIILQIASIIRFVFDATERLPQGKQRAKWLWLLIFLSPIACPAYYLLFVRGKIQNE